MDEPVDTLTDFNSNKASLQRVDRLVRDYYIFSNSKDYPNMFNTVMNLQGECHYKMNGKWKKWREESEESFNKLEKKYGLFDRNKHEFNLKKDLYREIRIYFLFLMDFMGDRGMLLVDKEEDIGL